MDSVFDKIAESTVTFNLGDEEVSICTRILYFAAISDPRAPRLGGNFTSLSIHPHQQV